MTYKLSFKNNNSNKSLWKFNPPVIYYTPNILNNASFENGWDGLVNGALATPTISGTLDRSTTHAYSGSWSAKRTLIQTGFPIVSWNSSNPARIRAPGSNFSNGTNIGVYNTSTTLDIAIPGNGYAKAVDVDNFDLYADSNLTIPISSSTGGGSGSIFSVASIGDVGGSVHVPFWYGSAAPTFQYNPVPPIPPTQVDCLWSRFYFYMQSPVIGSPNLSFKFFLHFSSTGQQMGGLYGWTNNGSGWLIWTLIDWLYWTSNVQIASFSSFADGWHSIETEYLRNGHPSGWPAVRIYLDNVLQTFPSLPLSSSNPTANPTGSWPAYRDTDGYIIAGYRVNSADSSRPSEYNQSWCPGLTTKIGEVYYLGTLNGQAGSFNATGSACWYDNLSLSYAGRIGP